MNAEDYAVDLRIVSDGREWRLTGQILGPQARGQIALKDASRVVHTSIDQLGRFTLPAVPGGTYMLDVQLNDVEIDYNGLELQ